MIFIRYSFYVIDIDTLFIKLVKFKKISIIRILRIKTFRDRYRGSILSKIDQKHLTHPQGTPVLN